MKREIKFRGKNKDGKWHYGMPISTHVGTYIIEEENPHVCSLYGYMEIDELSLVEPETVGQYTGIKDINGKEIYEGDIVRGSEIDCLDCPQNILKKCDNTKCVKKDVYRDVVSFDRMRFWLKNEHFGDEGEELSDYRIAEIIGNVFDNPKLLKS